MVFARHSFTAAWLRNCSYWFDCIFFVFVIFLNVCLQVAWEQTSNIYSTVLNTSIEFVKWFPLFNDAINTQKSSNIFPQILIPFEQTLQLFNFRENLTTTKKKVWFETWSKFFLPSLKKYLKKIKARKWIDCQHDLYFKWMDLCKPQMLPSFTCL